ncbi:hypothetical protein EST38_g13842 [Candolleomyces aberdarensis]|uniref:Triacylglycerol lipase n=1 Tax=Candolleomyces aberdarensis TaxID=2316362 RepID=A0A4Q2CYY4_9AGAR|nr:hypothetical protein EST38_g13842 [Candolleomyces aberdarensis]
MLTRRLLAIPFLFPVILIHGFSDIPALSGSWKLVEKFLSEMGVEYFTPQIPPHGGIEERSMVLIKQIASRYCGQTVHLFGHSMGGINARDIASKAMTFNLGFRIQTVTTFGTPHRGVKMINFAPSMPDALGQTLSAIIGTDFRAFGSLTHWYMSNYNRQIENNPSVRYFSWAGFTEVPTPLFTPVYPSSRVFGQTDGLVNTSSAVWDNDLGPRTHLGTVEGLDHVATKPTHPTPHLHFHNPLLYSSGPHHLHSQS